MKRDLEGKKAVIIARASSTKQVDKGATITHQISVCEYYIEKHGLHLQETFTLVETGRHSEERKFFSEVIDYCCDRKNGIEVAVFKDISRFTREGPLAYFELKNKLTEAGISLVDTMGVIQDEENSLEHLGLSYDWSRYSPSAKAEALEAEEAKSEVKNALTRMIGAEVQYVRDPASYSVRRPEYGYTNIKVDVRGKKRAIRHPYDPEAKWIRKMYELRIEGLLSDKEIVEKLNNAGFKTRAINRRDNRSKEIVGKTGEKPLTVKQFQRFISNPVYAGVVYEKWVPDPIKSNLWEGIVDIDTYNRANRGKFYIEENIDGSVSLINEVKRKVVVRDKNNKSYPFKNYILCPICGSKLKGSASTGKTGNRYPYYHCERGHKRFSVTKKDLENTVNQFIAGLRFKEKFARDFRIVVRELYQEEREKLSKSSTEASSLVQNIEAELKLLMERIVSTESQIVRADLEKKYEEGKLDLALALDNRNKSDEKKFDIDYFENELIKLVENPTKLLEQGAKTVGLGNMFSRFFTEAPNYEDLVSGNPKLTPIFELSRNQDISKRQMVSLTSLSWNTFSTVYSRLTKN